MLSTWLSLLHELNFRVDKCFHFHTLLSSCHEEVAYNSYLLFFSFIDFLICPEDKVVDYWVELLIPLYPSLSKKKAYCSPHEVLFTEKSVSATIFTLR